MLQTLQISDTADYMEWSPSWDDNRFLASQEICLVFKNAKVHYRIHKRPALLPIASQLNPVRASDFTHSTFQFFPSKTSTSITASDYVNKSSNKEH